MSVQGDRGLFPPVQDIVATAIICMTYFMRIASAADPDVHTPEILLFTTDLLFPVGAFAWLFVVAILVLVENYTD